jgi:hypothetical protein
MSDLVPETPFSGVVRVVKLMNGEELLGIVQEVCTNHISMILPAKVETAYSKDENGLLIEYVKLTNYAASVKNNEIVLNKTAIMFVGDPISDMLTMYQTFFETMKTDPGSVRTSTSDGFVSGPEAGLEMLNELFTNEDFVNFVNDLIDNFESENMENILLDEEEISEETDSLLPESSISDSDAEEAPKPPKRKKRAKMKPEPKDMPFNPEGNPNTGESWSDNPEDYL